MKTLIILASLAAIACAKPPVKTADYTAHEWGTFTSVQGQDGVQLEWNPFTVPDLPKFVYTVFNPAGRERRLVLPSFQLPGKANFLARQRMETPVIYFYADKPQTVDVSVSFPGGRITEWYPQLADPKAQAAPQPFATTIRGGMKWTGIELLPGDTAAEKLFPHDGTRSHYYPARETDSVPLRVKAPDGALQHEKMLFYRGIGDFVAPLNVQFRGDDAERMHLRNDGKEPLESLFIHVVKNDRALFLPVPALDPGVTIPVEIKFAETAAPLGEVRARLASEMRAALVREGLFEKEAAAMVKTWDDSWFGEQGMRVLYTLPRAWSDRTLPLTFSPAPRKIERVFVGRAEIITPAQEWALLREVGRYAEGGELENRAAAAAAADTGLGRFTEAALRRILLRGPGTRQFSTATSGLLDAIRPRGAPPQPPAWAGR